MMPALRHKLPEPAPGLDDHYASLAADKLTGHNSPDGREQINLAEERFNDNLRECARLLQDKLYLRGTTPFMITRAADVPGRREIEDKEGEAIEIAGIRHRPGSLVFAVATSDRAAFQLDERALFHKLDKRSGEWLPATCPEKLSRRLVGVASELGFRPCSGFARTPLFLDGKVIAAPGWNAATGMILDPPLDMPAIPDQPTKADATAALKRLLRPSRGYLNDNQNLECVFAAAAITAALRASLPTAPAIVLDGNTIGAGKGKAARALAVIAVASCRP